MGDGEQHILLGHGRQIAPGFFQSVLRDEHQRFGPGNAGVPNLLGPEDDLADAVARFHRHRIIIPLGHPQARHHPGVAHELGRGAHFCPGRPGQHQMIFVFQMMGKAGFDGLDGHDGLARQGLPLFTNDMGVISHIPLIKQARLQAQRIHQPQHIFASEIIIGHEISGAQFPDIQQRETLMLDGVDHAIGQIFVEGSAAVDIAGAVDAHRGADIQRPFGIAAARGGGDGVVGRGHRMLAAGHAKVEIIEHQHRQIYVAPGRIDEMGAANAGAAIADENDDMEIGIRQLDAGGVGDAASMQAMEGVGHEILIAEAHAANIADDHRLRRVDLQFRQGFIQMIEDQPVPASRTEGEGALVFIGFAGFCYLNRRDCHFSDSLSLCPVTISKNCWGVMS